MKGRGWSRCALTLAITGLLLTSCDWNQGGIEVINRTDRSLDIYYLVEGRERKVYTELDPAYSVPISSVLDPLDYCTKGTLIARDSAGVEVARRTEPICNHEEWIIGTPPP